MKNKNNTHTHTRISVMIKHIKTSDLRWNTHVSNVCTKARETYILAPRR